MLNKIIAFSVSNKLIIGLCTIFLIGFGVYELNKLPIDAVPDITDNQTQIITVAPSLGAPDVERLITIPIEQVTSNVPGILSMRSFSRFGLSIVTLVFEEEIDIYWARQQVTERLQQIQSQLPAGIETPALGPITTGLGEIYQYTVRAQKGYEKKYDAKELRTIQDWIVRKQLLGVKGVADVSSFGGFKKQFEVAIHPQKLKANNISIDEVFRALQANNENIGGAYIEKGPNALFIRSEGMVENSSDISQIVVKTLPSGIPLLIRDVAAVGEGHATRYGALTYNGEAQVSGAIVMMLKGANSKEVITNIKNKVASIQETLPEGVIIEPFLDRTKMVDNSISTVVTNLIEGALIVIFVLVLFLGNLRAGLLVASVIPLSLLFAIILMNAFGVSGNLMSLGALDFGLIVDGAVIIVEAVLHTLVAGKLISETNRLTQNQMDQTVKTAASRMMNSAVFGQIIILVVYLPIFSLEGIEGKMFKPMAQTVAFALVGAFILSLTYIPMMGALFLNKTIQQKPTLSDRMMGKLEKMYKKTLKTSFQHSTLVLSIVACLFISSLFFLTRMGGEFIPDLPEGDFAVETRVLTGSSLTTSIEAVSKSSKILLDKFPEVERVISKTGSSEIPTEPLPVDMSDMIIVLKDKSEWTSAKSYEELERKMRKELEQVVGVTYGFQFPVAMRFNELISGARQDVVVKIYGESMDTLANYAEKIGELCKNIDGTTGLYVESVSGMPQIVVHYNRALIAQYGATISDINRIVNSAFAGQVSGQVYEGEKRFDLVVRLQENQRTDISDVQNLLIPLSDGQQIPLSALATVSIIDSPNQIQRENAHRRIMVGFNVDGRDIQSIVGELQRKIESNIQLPVGYQLEYGGAFKNLEEAKTRLYVAVPISLALIFLLLFFAFKSVKQGLLIYSAIPLSAIGGIFALVIRDIPFSISAGVGFIALFGVAVLNGIILIAEFNRIKNEGMKNTKDIVIKGATSRLRPVLMTASVASLGFLPMALSTGEGAEVQRPLATVVIGGLLVATFLTLYVLPLLYALSTTKKPVNHPHIIPIIGFLFCFFGANGQQLITLEKATELAIQNNKGIRNERLISNFQQLRIKESASIPQTNLTGEYGQINSIYTDVNVGISQSFEFPTVYASQKRMLTEEWKSSKLLLENKELELKTQIATCFVQLTSLLEKKKLLELSDSLYRQFLHISNQRFKGGSTSILEQLSAENQQGQIEIQMQELNSDIAILLAQFQLLLNTETEYIPDGTQLNLIHVAQQSDTIALKNHPMSIFYKQQHVMAKAATRLEKSRMLPNLNVGYKTMSMRGMGADNMQYGRDLRFQSIQVGVGIPLFFGSQRARIQSFKLMEQITNNAYEIQVQQVQSNYNTQLMRYENLLKTVAFYEQKTVKNSKTMRQTADVQYQNGDINYLEWMLVINQTMQLENEYIDAVLKKNLATITLNNLLNK